MSDISESIGAALAIYKWYKGVRRLRALRELMPKRKRALEDLMKIVRGAKTRDDASRAQRALEVGGKVEISDAHRKFVTQFLASIPSSRSIRAVKIRRLKSVVVFVCGLVLGSSDGVAEELRRSQGAVCDVIRNAGRMFEALTRLCDTKYPGQSLRVVRWRVNHFNAQRLAFMIAFHEWRKHDIEALLNEAAPLYRQLLMMRTSDSKGASRRLDMMLRRITSVVGRKEARHWDLLQRREAARRLAEMLGDASVVDGDNDYDKTRTESAVPMVQGARVTLKTLGRGVLRFLGGTDFGPGQWAGVELDYPVGRNDGAVRGKRYFTCREGHGIFVRPKKLAIVRTTADSASSKSSSLVRQGISKVGPTASDADQADSERDDDGDDEGEHDASKDDDDNDAKSSECADSSVSARIGLNVETYAGRHDQGVLSQKSSEIRQECVRMSSGLTSSGGGCTSLSDGASEGGSRVSGSDRRRRQSLARSVASAIAQRVKTLRSQELVHELIMNPQFELTPPDQEDSANAEAYRRLVSKIRQGEFRNLASFIVEITNSLVAVGGGSRNKYVEAEAADLNATVSEISRLVGLSLSSTGVAVALSSTTKRWFVCVGKMLLKLQSPAHDSKTRAWIASWRDCDAICKSPEIIVDGFKWVVVSIATIRVESTNHTIRTKLKPLLSARGGVDFERRNVASQVRAGALSFDPNGSSSIHEWLRASTLRWCASAKAEKKRLRNVLLRNADALKSCACSAFLDLVLPPSKMPVPVFYSAPPVTFAMDRSRLALIRNKLHGMCVKAALAGIVEQIASNLRAASDGVVLSSSSSSIRGTYARLEGLLLNEGTSETHLMSQVLFEIQYRMSGADESEESTHLPLKVASSLPDNIRARVQMLVRQVMDPTKPLLQLVARRVRNVLLSYLVVEDASESSLRGTLHEEKLKYIRQDIEALAHPAAAVSTSMRSGRAVSFAAATADRPESADSSVGVMRRLFTHHWAVYSTHYTPIVVASAQSRAKEILC
eukprot:g1444.t1